MLNTVTPSKEGQQESHTFTATSGVASYQEDGPWSPKHVAEWLGDAAEEGEFDAAWPRLLEHHDINGAQLNNLTHELLLQMVHTSKDDQVPVLSQLGEQLKFEQYLTDKWKRRDDVLAVDETFLPEQSELLTRFVDVNKSDVNAVLKAIDTRGDLNHQEPLPSKVTTTVPVFLTLVVKRFIEDATNDEPPFLLGTLIQRPLMVPLKNVVRNNCDTPKPYFDTLFNDLFPNSDEQFQLRHVTPTPIRIIPPETSEGKAKDGIESVVGELAACTFNVKFPFLVRERSTDPTRRAIA